MQKTARKEKETQDRQEKYKTDTKDGGLKNKTNMSAKELNTLIKCKKRKIMKSGKREMD